MADPGLLLPDFLSFLGALALATLRSSPGQADRPLVRTEPIPPPLPAGVDLRPQLPQWDLAPRRQGPRGTCSVFTVVGALEYAAASARQQGRRALAAAYSSAP